MRLQIYIGNTEVYTDSDTRPLITKQVIDIQQPENRKTDRTLSFNLPGTPANDVVFGAMFEVNLDIQNNTTTQFNPDFNPNLKANILITVDTIPQLSGYCQLNEIGLDKNGKVFYEIVAYGVTSDVFATIGEALVTDLDFSEYDHTWNTSNISNSWETSIVENGVAVPFEIGKGYVYPMIDYGLNTNPAQWKVKQFLPAIYLKEYIDKIFEGAGFSYESAFLTSDFFKRLVIPFSAQELKISNSDIEQRLIDVERITTAQNAEPLDWVNQSPDLSTAVKIAFQQENADPSNQWSTDTFTAANSGTYIFGAYFNLAFRNNSGGNFTLYNDISASVALVLERGGVRTALSDFISPSIDPGSPWTNGTTTSSTDWFINFPEVQLYTGDQIFMTCAFVTARGTLNGNVINSTFFAGDGIEFVNGVGSYFVNQIGSEQVIEGDTMPMNSTLPVDIKQKDLLLGIIRLFNLYIEPQENNKLLIEPRDDYYTEDVEDWTYKLDHDQTVKIQPMGLLDAERYTFQYTPDQDYLNNQHQERYGFTYGRRRYDVINQFVKTDKVIQPIFAPTPLYAPQGYSSRIVSQIKFVDQDGNTANKASKPRVLYYGGLLSTEDWLLRSQTVTGVTQTVYNEYPYAGHLDNPFTPTLDLNYGAPQEIYYGSAFVTQQTLQYTDNNLYKVYWQKFIEEITNRNSKVYKGYFYLQPKDIYNLSFRKQYLIQEAYYRLLRVDNYDPISNAPCLCTFIKIENIQIPASTTANILGGTGTLGTNDTPPFRLPQLKNDNKFGSENGVVLGESNLVGGGVSKTLVLGDGNIIPGGVDTDIVLGGDDNAILTDRVVIINSDGQFVTEPNTTIINNVRYPNRVEVSIDSATMLSIGSSPVQVWFAPGSDRYLEAIEVRARRTNSTVGYTSQVIVLQYINAGVNVATFATELLTQTGDAIYKATIPVDLADNDGFQLTTQSLADPTTGDGDFVFYIDFIIQDI